MPDTDSEYAPDESDVSVDAVPALERAQRKAARCPLRLQRGAGHARCDAEAERSDFTEELEPVEAGHRTRVSVRQDFAPILDV